MHAKALIMKLQHFISFSSLVKGCQFDILAMVYGTINLMHTCAKIIMCMPLYNAFVVIKVKTPITYSSFCPCFKVMKLQNELNTQILHYENPNNKLHKNGICEKQFRTVPYC